MATFLAYFDLLGYKKFIENNTPEHLDLRTNHFARNIEMAISLDLPLVQTPSGKTVPDISRSRLNCLNFSDTVVLWTKGESLEEFIELFKVAFGYNNFNVLHDFPSRGCIVYGDLWYKPYNQKNPEGGLYALNMIYGKALIDAHLKAENMSWAGCIVDQSAITKAMTLGNIDKLLSDHTLEHNVPYKNNGEEIRKIEVALKLFKGETPIIEHYAEGIAKAFTQDNKGEIKGRTEVIYNHTIDFLKRHQIQFPFYFHSRVNPNEDIYGRLDADFILTQIIKKTGENGNEEYSVTKDKFDPYSSDRNLLKEPRISEDTFVQLFENTN